MKDLNKDELLEWLATIVSNLNRVEQYHKQAYSQIEKILEEHFARLACLRLYQKWEIERDKGYEEEEKDK